MFKQREGEILIFRLPSPPQEHAVQAVAGSVPICAIPGAREQIPQLPPSSKIPSSLSTSTPSFEVWLHRFHENTHRLRAEQGECSGHRDKVHCKRQRVGNTETVPFLFLLMSQHEESVV